MKILIVEDEPRAASQLQTMLSACNFEYELLVTLDTIEDSVSWFRDNKAPDLIFMDIQLADGLSFEIFQQVDIDAPIIFTTAFDQYAIKAFKVNSVDYLLKPIQKEDLGAALAKFNKSKTPAASIDNDILKQLLGSIQKPKTRSGILVKEGSSFIQVEVSIFSYFYSEDSITFGITKNKRFIIDETVDQLYTTLDQDQFYKINRGQVINKQAILKIDPYFNHRVKLSVSNSRDQEFVVSRQKTTEFKNWMNK
jgi:DNA-binding LytR/AlgR family response regulator